MQVSWKAYEYITASALIPSFSQHFPVWAACRAMPYETEILKKCIRSAMRVLCRKSRGNLKQKFPAKDDCPPLKKIRGGEKGKRCVSCKAIFWSLENCRHLCSLNKNNMKQANKTRDGSDHITMNLWKLNRAKGREDKEVYIPIKLLPLPAQPSGAAWKPLQQYSALDSLPYSQLAFPEK